MGMPSATMLMLGFLGGGVGMGMPSATMFMLGFLGGGVGIGMPSATCPPFFHRGVCLDGLTFAEPISTIRLREIAATGMRIFFCMGSLLQLTMQRRMNSG
jgi:hypothetical protein